jgi:hypothetical protein
MNFDGPRHGQKSWRMRLVDSQNLLWVQPAIRSLEYRLQPGFRPPIGGTPTQVPSKVHLATVADQENERVRLELPPNDDVALERAARWTGLNKASFAHMAVLELIMIVEAEAGAR